MIKVEDRYLYERESQKMNEFTQHVLVKQSERYAGQDSDDFDDGYRHQDATTIVDSPFELDNKDTGFGGFGDDSFGGFGGNSGGFGDDSFGGNSFGGFGDSGGFGGFGSQPDDEAHKGITEEGNLRNNQDHLNVRNPMIRFLISPIFLFYYVVLHMTRNNIGLKSWEDELSMIKRVNFIIIGSALIFFLFDGSTIVSPTFQIIVGVVMIITAHILLNVVRGGVQQDESPQEEQPSGFDGFNSNNESDDVFGGNNTGFTDNVDIFGDDDAPKNDLRDLNEGEDDMFEDPYDDGKPKLGVSPLNVNDDNAFLQDLTNVFKTTERYAGTGGRHMPRPELVQSFAPYLATNYQNFGQWKIVNESSITYRNLVFTLFLALNKINNKFGKAQKEEDEYGGTRKVYDKLFINDVKENTMMYRVEFELPNYFNFNTLTRKQEEFYNVLKANENDTDVKILLSTFRQGFVIKIFKPVNEIISIGDILRYNDTTTDGPSALEEFTDEGKGLPLLLGIKNSEYPFVIDYEDNTSGAIVGGSGSGKSWATFSFLSNFLVSNDYHNLQIMVFDKKDATFWNTMALSPHVIGFHSNLEDLLTICTEVYAEITRRKQVLKEEYAENFKSLRKKLRKNGDYEKIKRFPLLLFVVDEITSSMMELVEYDDDKETYNAVRNMMAKITAEGRSLGVRMVVIGQRSIDTSMPKFVIANSSFKFGMKLDNKNDFNSFDMEHAVKELGFPERIGEGIVTTQGEEASFIKTLGVGGRNDDQILWLIRALALEWNRRSIGDEFISETTNVFKTSYNRHIFREKAFEMLERGELIHDQVNANIAINPYQTIEHTEEEEEEVEGTFNQGDDYDAPQSQIVDNHLLEDDIIDNNSTDDFNLDDTFNFREGEESDNSNYDNHHHSDDFDYPNDNGNSDNRNDYDFREDAYSGREVDTSEHNHSENSNTLDDEEIELDDDDIIEFEDDDFSDTDVQQTDTNQEDFDEDWGDDLEVIQDTSPDVKYDDSSDDFTSMNENAQQHKERTQDADFDDLDVQEHNDDINTFSEPEEVINTQTEDVPVNTNDDFDDIRIESSDEDASRVSDNVSREQTRVSNETHTEPTTRPTKSKTQSTKPPVQRRVKSKVDSRPAEQKKEAPVPKRKPVRPTQPPEKKRTERKPGGVMFRPPEQKVNTHSRKVTPQEILKLKRYFLQHGTPHLTKFYVLQSELHEKFENVVIQEALDSNVILEYERDKYIAKL